MTENKFVYRVDYRKGDRRGCAYSKGSLDVLWVDSLSNSVPHIKIEHADYGQQCSSSIHLTRLHAVQLMKSIASTLQENPDD